MRSRWAKARLSDHVDIQTGYPFKSDDFTSDPADPKLVRGDNVIQGRFRWDGVKRWPRTKLDGLDPYRLQPRDVVVAMDRPWIEAGLKRATIGLDDGPLYLVQRVARLRGRNGLNQKYLRYLIDSVEFTNHVLAVQTGTSVPHISGSQILEFEFRMPPPDTQRAIASVLGALDDKIEANRALNETLEAAFQALFRSWFVEFEPVVSMSEGRCPSHLSSDAAAVFPDRLEDSPLGQIPAGWHAGRIHDICDLYRESIAPSASPDETFLHFSFAAFDGSRSPTTEMGSSIRSNKYVVPAGAVLLAKLNPHIPRVWWPDDVEGLKRIASTEFLVATPRPPFVRTYVYGLLSSSSFLDEFACLVTGTSNSHQRVRPNDFLDMPIVLPGEAAVAMANQILSPIKGTQIANRRESATLTTLRDTLLPRLLSGDLRVQQAETLVESAV